MSAYSYLCLECSERHTQYLAQCPKCNAWGSLISKDEPANPAIDVIDERDVIARRFEASRQIAAQAAVADIADMLAMSTRVEAPPRAVPLAQIPRVAEALARASTGYREVDRVLGGGLLDGAPILLAGAPGAGKSTLVLGVADRVAIQPDRDVVYVTGEESVEKVAHRADRLGVRAERLALVHETNLERILEIGGRSCPSLFVVDSAQVIKSAALPSEAGSVNQVRLCVARLSEFANETKTPVLIVGHVTRDGDVSGPKTLEHLVDVVLYLDVPDQSSPRRILTASKNRHGDTTEVGVLEMTARGLIDVEVDTAQLAPRQVAAPGSILCPAVFGERVALVEIEALVGPEREGRVSGEIHSAGVDRARVARILAILARHTSVDVTDRNVYVSVAGGLRVADPCADLAIALAIAGSARGAAYAPGIVACGELALSGEVREPVPRREARVAETKRTLRFGVLIDGGTLADAVRSANSAHAEHHFAGDGADCATCGEGRAHYLHRNTIPCPTCGSAVIGDEQNFTCGNCNHVRVRVPV